MPRKYQIILSHGEVIETDLEDAYYAYKAVCVRLNVSPMDLHTFAISESVRLDRLIFKEANSNYNFLNL